MTKTTTPKAAIAAATAAIEASPSTFDSAVAFVLADRIEGGYVDDPRDPGGETNFGISKRSYPDVDMKSLTREDAIAIYKCDYWDTVEGDDLPPAIAIAMFDCAVNQSVSAARKLLQKSVRVKADGIIGPITMKAVNAAYKRDPKDAVVEFLSYRLLRYSGTANRLTYMRGWSVRVLLLLDFLITKDAPE